MLLLQLTSNITATHNKAMSTQLGFETGKSKPSSSWLQRMAANLGFTSTVSLRDTLERAIGETAEEDDKSLSPQERAMLLNVLGFGETRVAEVMMPRADIIALEEDQPVAALLALYARAGHSRVPVFRSSLDNPIGMVHIKDAMVWATDGDASDGRDRACDHENPVARMSFGADLLSKTIAEAKLVREVLFVPPSMPALTLLAKMKAKQIHLALVVDEFGGTDGLVTFEDLIEEIIGDIADEHDNSQLHAIRREDEAFVASARTPIEDVEQVLGMELTPRGVSSEVETLGGLILASVGSVPKRGQIIPHASGVTFEILEAGPRRLHTVRILKQRALPPPDKKLRQPGPGGEMSGNAENENSSNLHGAQAA
jgi:magnesium and cobalt transporter